MSVTSMILAPTRDFFSWLGNSIAIRFSRMIGGAMIFLVIGSFLYVYGFIDRSLNYVPVDAVTRAVEHECKAHRDVRRSHDRWSTEYLPGTWTCERLRSLVETDPGYRSFAINEEVYARVVYRSPVDKALYIGRISIGYQYRDTALSEGTPIRILASTHTPGQITFCCDGRLDWFDRSIANL